MHLLWQQNFQTLTSEVQIKAIQLSWTILDKTGQFKGPEGTGKNSVLNSTQLSSQLSSQLRLLSELVVTLRAGESVVTSGAAE